MAFWVRIHSFGTNTVLRMTNNINYDASYYSNRVLSIMIYDSNYMYFSFADSYSANHNVQTANSFFKLYIWYYIVCSADYELG